MPATATHERAVEADDLYDGPPHCTCGSYWPCEAVRTRPEPVERPVSDEARRIGTLALVEVGASVWSRDRRDKDDTRLGGTVLDVDEWIDFETGERRRSYLCIDSVADRERGTPFRIRKIDEAELGEHSVEMPNTKTLKGHVKRLSEAVTKAMSKGGPVLPEVADWGRHIERLLVLIGHGGRP